MDMRRVLGAVRRAWGACVLSLCAHAIGAHALGAQVKPDSVTRGPADSLAVRAAQDSALKAVAKITADSLRDARAQVRIDSIYRVKMADTIKSPLARFERPDDTELSSRLTFSRDRILTSGAVNLADLLDQVPGVTTFRTGWMAGIHAAAYNGDFSRIRVFYDGVERDAVESRNGGVLDLDDVPLWALDEIVIERVAGEIRVWLKGWTVRRTTAFSRVDIFTGDLNTNGFRGLLGRRFRNGVSFQLMAQQMATQSGRVSAFSSGQRAAGDGNGQIVDARLGWARGRYTVDLVGSGVSRERDALTAREGFTSLPAFKGARREAYARVAYGDSLRGLWSQAIVGVLRTKLSGIGGTGTEVDSTISRDTIGARTQQIFAVGYRASLWHASLTDRVRPVAGTSYHAPLLRLGVGTDRYRLAAVGERRGLDSLTQIDVSGIARPLSWLAFTASQSRRTFLDTMRIATTTSRAEAAVRYRRLWLGGGVIREGEVEYASPVLLGAPNARLPMSATTGVMGIAHGMLYKDVALDVQAIHWDAAQYSRPRLSVRTEVALVSSWLSRFPKGQFSINARVSHELRDPVPFFWTEGKTQIQRTTESSQLVTGLLEIRIQSATIFYQYRNITGRAYEQIPGLTMPPAVQMYGMRWEFWN